MTEVRLGSIIGGHGIKGWVKVFSYTDPMEAIFGYSHWVLRKGGVEQRVNPDKSQVQGKKLIAHFEGVDTRTMADEMAGFEIYIEQDVLPDLDTGDYYWYQLTGLKVINAEGDFFGKVDHLLETGANDVLVVHPTDESIDDRERLIPFVEEEFVQEVNIEGGEIRVNWATDY